MDRTGPAATRRRAWVVVTAFAVVGAVTQLLWLTYAPVTSDAARDYGVSETAIGWLANVFPLWYVVLAIPAGLALDRWLRPTLLLGAVLTAAGGCVRLVADDYTAAILGQSLVAIAQPLVLTAISPVASRYLPGRDRPKGIALASAGTFAGMIVAFVLATVLSLSTVLVVDAVVAIAAALVLAIALREAPTFVPEVPVGVRGLGGFVTAWRNPVVRRMCLLVPVPFGTFTALTTWAQPLLEPAGVSSDEAGILLLLNVTAGVIGCALIPVWAARRHRERTAMVAGVTATVVACAVLALVPSFAVGIVCFLAVGALLLPALPIVLEISERSAGDRAGAAAGLVWLAGQLGALVITGVAGVIVDAPAVTFAFLAVVTLAAVPAMLRTLPSSSGAEGPSGVQGPARVNVS
jgi:predicted MFS family arabinose efflux permease